MYDIRTDSISRSRLRFSSFCFSYSSKAAVCAFSILLPTDTVLNVASPVSIEPMTPTGFTSVTKVLAPLVALRISIHTSSSSSYSFCNSYRRCKIGNSFFFCSNTSGATRVKSCFATYSK